MENKRLKIDLDKYECYLGKKKIVLTTKEMEMLIHLTKLPNQIWTHQQLYERIWSFEGTGNIDTVRVHISYLRRKIEEDPSNPQFIKTVHGYGYYFSSDNTKKQHPRS